MMQQMQQQQASQQQQQHQHHHQHQQQQQQQTTADVFIKSVIPHGSGYASYDAISLGKRPDRVCNVPLVKATAETLEGYAVVFPAEDFDAQKVSVDVDEWSDLSFFFVVVRCVLVSFLQPFVSACCRRLQHRENCVGVCVCLGCVLTHTRACVCPCVGSIVDLQLTFFSS